MKLTKKQKRDMEKIIDDLSEYQNKLGEAHERLADKYFPRSDRWKESDRGYVAAHMVSELDNAETNLDNLLETLKTIIDLQGE